MAIGAGLQGHDKSDGAPSLAASHSPPGSPSFGAETSDDTESPAAFQSLPGSPSLSAEESDGTRSPAASQLPPGSPSIRSEKSDNVSVRVSSPPLPDSPDLGPDIDPLDLDLGGLDDIFEIPDTVTTGHNDGVTREELPSAPTISQIRNYTVDEAAMLDHFMIEAAPTYQSADNLGKWLGLFKTKGRGKHPLDEFIATDETNQSVVKEYNAWNRTNTELSLIREDAVLPAIAIGETSAKQRYSSVRKDDQATWKAKNWNAWAVVQLTKAHVTLESGIFHQRSWSRAQALNRMWHLWLRIKLKYPTQKTRPLPKNATKAEIAAARKQAAAVKNAQAAQKKAENLAALKKKSKQELAAIVNKKRDMLAGAQTGKGDATKPSSEGDKEQAKPQDGEADATKPSSNGSTADHGMSDALRAALKAFAQGDPMAVGDNDVDVVAEALAGIEDDDEFYTLLTAHDKSTDYQFARRMDGDAVQKLLKANQAHVMQLVQQYKQMLQGKGMTEQTMNVKAKEKLLQHEEFHWMRRLGRAYQAAYDLDQMAVPSDMVKNIDTVGLEGHEPEAAVAGTTKAEDTASRFATEEETLEDELTKFSNMSDLAETPLTMKIDDRDENTRKAAREATRLLTNTKYERTNLRETCEMLNLHPDQPFRLPGMKPAGICLKWWQPDEIKSIRQLIARGITRGILLSSLVGLGKTFTSLGLILSYWADRMRALKKMQALPTKSERVAAYKALGPNKPWLIIVPNVTLLLQWCREAAVLSDKFDMYIYHRDKNIRSAASRSNKDNTDSADEEDHSTEDGLPPNCYRHARMFTSRSKVLKPVDNGRIKLIISTPETFRNRHGPAALLDHRMSGHKKMTKKQREKQRLVYERAGWYSRPDPRWNRHLAGRFAGLIKDEAHDIRNPDSQSNIALRWLDTPINVLASATPLWNDTTDIRGFLQFMFTKKAQEEYKQLPEKAAERKKGPNPYDPKLRQREIEQFGEVSPSLRRKALMPDAFEEFTVNYASIVGGASLDHAEAVIDAIKSETEVRHTYESTPFPGRHEFAIGNHLPDLFNVPITIHLPEGLREIYKTYSEPHMQRYRMPVPAKSHKSGVRRGEDDVGINSNAARALSVGSSYPILFLTGIPKTDKYILEDVEKLDQARDTLISSAQTIWDQRFEEEGGCEDSRPTRDSVLRKVWYKYESEYSFMEIDHNTYFARLVAAAPRKVCGPAYAMHYLFLLTANNTEHADKATEESLSENETENSASDDERNSEHSKDEDGDEDEPGKPEAPKCPPPALRVPLASSSWPINYFATLPPTLPTSARDVPAGWLEMLAKIMRATSPRIQTISQIILECVKRQEKASFWVSYPISQKLLHAYMVLIHQRAEVFSSSLETDARERIIKAYNSRDVPSGDANNSFDFLINSYKVGGTGINYHGASHVLVQVDSPSTLSEKIQCDGRAYRLGQMADVYIYNIQVAGTYDSDQYGRMMIRSAADVRNKIDAETLMEQTGARAPDDVNRIDFAKKLKADATGFYRNPALTLPLRIRHETAWDLDEDGLNYLIPQDYEIMDNEELAEELFDMIHGRTKIRPAKALSPDPSDDADVASPNTPKSAKKGKSKSGILGGKGLEHLNKKTYMYGNTDLYHPKTQKAQLVRFAEELDVNFGKKKPMGMTKEALREAIMAAHSGNGQKRSAEEDADGEPSPKRTTRRLKRGTRK